MKKLKIFKAKKILHNNGQIIVFEKSSKIDFNFKRVFIVKSNKSKIRGKHAHKRCAQLLNCPIGSVEVQCETKNKIKYSFMLNRPEKYLIIPPMVWAVQIYKKDNTILTVICDKVFNEKDYIRDYNNFLKY